jgi:hypothetical protein
MKTCTGCGLEKSPEAFSFRNKVTGERQARCRDCAKAYATAYRAENRERRLEELRAYYAENRERLLQQKREHYAANREEMVSKAREKRERNREKDRAAARAYYRRNREARIAYNRKYGMKLKLDALAAYGVHCQCCGVCETSFLTIDHIDGCSKEQRRTEGLGRQFYLWLKKNDYPTGYQTLCFNCNMGRQVNGGICPHQT